ncbi:hypothetical protein BZG36_04739 [Bifiguratus adelaidae]|uniref:PH domain-containing protein n=1 Tax=Bifiguratus adelaidae TaxID=1938954 RepID=A0A261XUR7_9FUNG|nr:hypothetical protein BZG36_04739 [Bifiguratus adelaidae]
MDPLTQQQHGGTQNTTDAGYGQGALESPSTPSAPSGSGSLRNRIGSFGKNSLNRTSSLLGRSSTLRNKFGGSNSTPIHTSTGTTSFETGILQPDDTPGSPTLTRNSVDDDDRQSEANTNTTNVTASSNVPYTTGGGSTAQLSGQNLAPPPVIYARKSTAGNDLGMENAISPTDMIVSRLAAWKRVVKSLFLYFETMATIEKNAADHYAKLASHIILPFKESGVHFKPQQGIQDVFYAFQSGTRNMSGKHAEIVQYIESSLLVTLRNLKREIKAKIKLLSNDDRWQTFNLYKEVENTKKQLADLDRACGLAVGGALSTTEKTDPWLINIHVQQALHRQIAEENRLHKAMLDLQRDMRQYESTNIIGTLKRIASKFVAWRGQNDNMLIGHIYEDIEQALNHVGAEDEWDAWVAQYGDRLVQENAGYKDPQGVRYANMDHRYVQALRAGKMERKGNLLKSWNDYYYVVTPAGFLHEFKSSENLSSPLKSYFLPGSGVGVPSSATKSSVAHMDTGIEIHAKPTQGLVKNEKHLILRATTPADMAEWMSHLVELSRKAPPKPAPGVLASLGVSSIVGSEKTENETETAEAVSPRDSLDSAREAERPALPERRVEAQPEATGEDHEGHAGLGGAIADFTSGVAGTALADKEEHADADDDEQFHETYTDRHGDNAAADSDSSYEESVGFAPTTLQSTNPFEEDAPSRQSSGDSQGLVGYAHGVTGAAPAPTGPPSAFFPHFVGSIDPETHTTQNPNPVETGQQEEYRPT